MGLREAITATIRYGERFGVKLSSDQISNRLISKKVYKEDDVKRVIEGMRQDGKGFLLEERSANKEYLHKLRKAKSMAKRLGGKFRDISFIGVTGSVSSGKPKREDDIDLMIITKANSLWTTRLGLRWYIWKERIPHRKRNQAEKRDDFCFNLWLDRKHLKLPIAKRNLKNAIDFIMMIPLYNRNNCYEEFVLSNEWVKRYAATGYAKKEALCLKAVIEKEEGGSQGGEIKKLVNKICFWGQLMYIRLHSRNRWVSEGRAFFHDEIL